MADSLAPCRNCGEEILAGTTECPHCDHDVHVHNRRRLWLGAIGTVLTLTVVLSPIGIPLLWRAHRHRQLAETTVTEQPSSTLGGQLRSVFKRQLGLDKPAMSQADFTRGSSDSRRFGRPPKL